MIHTAVLETAVEDGMPAVQETVDRVRRIDVEQYKYGFVPDIESDKAPKGLRRHRPVISAKKNEPDWMLEWRLGAYRRWLTMTEPNWAEGRLSEDRLSGSLLLLGAKAEGAEGSLDEVDPELLKTYEKLGIPLREQEVLAGVWPGRERVAVDAVFDSVSVATTFKEELKKAGVIFCRSPKPCANIRSWCGSISARSFRSRTISTRR